MRPLPLLLLAAFLLPVAAAEQGPCGPPAAPDVQLQLLEARAGATLSLPLLLDGQGPLREASWRAILTPQRGEAREVPVEGPRELGAGRSWTTLAVELPAELPPGAWRVSLAYDGEWRPCGEPWRPIHWESATPFPPLVLVHAPDDESAWLAPAPGLDDATLRIPMGGTLALETPLRAGEAAYQNATWLLDLVMLDERGEAPLLDRHERWSGAARPGRHILRAVDGPRELPADATALLRVDLSLSDLPEGRYAIALALQGELVLPGGEIVTVDGLHVPRAQGLLEISGAPEPPPRMPPHDEPPLREIEEPPRASQEGGESAPRATPAPAAALACAAAALGSRRYGRRR